MTESTINQNNYLQKLIDLMGSSPPSHVHRVQVQHDDWCNFINGRGSCNCDPDLVTKHTEQPILTLPAQYKASGVDQ